MTFSFVKCRYLLQKLLDKSMTVSLERVLLTLLFGLRFCSHSDDYEEYYFLGCDAMLCGRSPALQRNVQFPASGLWSKAREQEASRSQQAAQLLSLYCWFLAWIILRPRKQRQYVPLKRQWTSSGLKSRSSRRWHFSTFVFFPQRIWMCWCSLFGIC
jgi:hypothetical protein